MSLLKEIKKIFVNTCVEKFSINKINKNDKTILLLRTDLIGDYLVTRVFLELIRKSKKFKDYKTVVLLNSAVKDLALEFDSKYADEFIFYDIRYSSPKTIKFLGESLSKYNFEYLINYHTLRHILPDEIAGAIKAKNKFALSNFALNLPDEKKDFYNKNYTKIFTASPDYFFGSVQFANLVTGENYSEHSATSCFGINETNFPKDKKLNLNYPYVILFPSASNVQKRMGFVHFLNIAKYVYETIKNKTGKEIKCVLLGSKKDNDIFKGYGINLPYIKNLCGKYKLSELPYIFNKALFAVTNETCAVHFAYTAGLKNALVFCNVYPPSESFIEYLKNKKEGDTFLFGKPNMGDFYYLYPEISVQKAMDENYKPVENVDLRVNQDLEGINQKYIYAALDNIIDNVAGTIK